MGRPEKETGEKGKEGVGWSGDQEPSRGFIFLLKRKEQSVGCADRGSNREQKRKEQSVGGADRGSKREPKGKEQSVGCAGGG